MKKTLYVLLVAAVIGAPLGQMAYAALGIAGSAHDFSAEGWSGGSICEPCHTPHNPQSTSAPLWDRSDPAGPFTTYGGAVLGFQSTLCLSCHDGVTNLDSFGGAIGTTNMATANPGSPAIVGTDLTDDHPVGMVINDAVQYYKQPTQYAVAYSNKVECASCHDVHNGMYDYKLLRDSNTGSRLCLDCHVK